MRRSRQLPLAMTVVLATTAARGAAQGPQGLADVPRALAEARAAVGGEKQLAKVHALSLAGTLQRMIGDRTVDGEVTIDLQLPDKMLRTDSISPMGDSALVVATDGLNGDALLRNTRVVNAPPGAMIRVPPAPAAGSDAEAQALRAARADLARLTVALLLAAPASMPLEFAEGGEAESADGKADVIDIKGPGSFAAKLFLDKSSHRPLMLTYRGVAPRFFMRRVQGQPPPGGRGPGGEPGADRAPGPPDVVDITLYFDDYRSEDGVMLPHHITRAFDGQTNEELTFKTIKMNPSFKAETFAIRN
jgi:hypothetical protein